MTDKDYQCRVAIVNSRKSGGGAATIATSLSESMEGYQLFVDNSTPFKKVLTSLFEKITNRLNKKKPGVIWSNGRRGNLKSVNEFNQFDIVHLHWINDSFLSVESISKITKPIVWTLHDLWPLTGGCHIPLNCERLKSQCGNCPKLGISNESDLSAKNFRLKKLNYLDKSIIWVAPSHYIKSEVLKNTTLSARQVKVIHNGIDLKPFEEIKRPASSNIPTLLFGALSWHEDKNKGANFLEETLYKLKQEGLQFHLKVFGAPITATFSTRLEYENLGEINKTDLPSIFAQSDLFLFPSLSETFGLMSVEAQASGTPVICFMGHGAEETIKHKSTGYSVNYLDQDDFISGIRYSLNNREDLSKSCKEWVLKNFSKEKMVENYNELYRELNDSKS